MVKTLKDIKIRKPKGIELGYLDDYEEKLKYEVIKWIKELDETTLGSGNICGDFEFPNCAIDDLPSTESNATTLIRWIKYFFNINRGIRS